MDDILTNLDVKEEYTTFREDGQICPVSIETDKRTGEIEAKQKSAPFFAYNKGNYKAKVQLAVQEPIANSILEYFVSEMDGTNAISVSMKILEKLFKMKRNAISKHIKVLTDRNFVEIFKSGNMNVYAVNAFVVFTKGDANLWKAKFKATVIMDYDEQTSAVKKEYVKQLTDK